MARRFDGQGGDAGGLAVAVYFRTVGASAANDSVPRGVAGIFFEGDSDSWRR